MHRPDGIGKDTEQNIHSDQTPAVSLMDADEARTATLEECQESLAILNKKNTLTPEECELHSVLDTRRRQLIEAISLKKHLEAGGRVLNPKALDEQQLVAQKVGQDNRCREIKADNKPLVTRAKQLKGDDLIKWADKKPVGVSPDKAALMLARGEKVDYAPEATEVNLYRLYDAMFVGGKIDEVHYDTAADVVRDEDGVEINDRWASRELVEAGRALQLKGLGAEKTVEALKKWARSHKLNDIRERFLAKLDTITWDGTDRSQTFLIDFLHGHDTRQNRTFTKYWLSSLYMRATLPGCYCPTTLVLIGGQHSGKSQFWRLVNQAVMCKKDVSTAGFDPSTKDKTRYLRAVSGKAFVGHMGEMKNFGAINTEDWKDFSTASEDAFDQKFRDHLSVQRQWIFGGDSNEYVGFWRDNADADAMGKSQGERRLYPFFVFQNATEGDFRWETSDEFKVDYSNFEYEFFQAVKQIQSLMAEIGLEGYHAIVDENTRMVREYSAAEKSKDQGTVRVKDFDEAFADVLEQADRYADVIRVGEKADSEQIFGIKYFCAGIKRAYDNYMPHGKGISGNTVTKKMVAFGAKAGRDPKTNVTCYVFDASAVFGSADGAVGKKAEEWSSEFAKKFLADKKTKLNF